MGMYCEVHAISPVDCKEMQADPEQLGGLISGAMNSGATVGLEKSWHGLHYLLTGSASAGAMPLGFLLQGGQLLEDDDDEAPARLLEPQLVQQLHTALAGISGEDLWKGFDPARMRKEGVYPDIWDEPEADLKEEYLGYFTELKRLVQQASKNGQALLIVLS